MEMGNGSSIKAVITTSKHNVSGGVPVFVTEGQEQLERLSLTLEKILDAAAHEIEEGMMIIVKH